MSRSIAASRRARASFRVLALLMPLGGAAVAASPPETFAVAGSVLPVAGASAPPSTMVVELRPAFPDFEAQRAAVHGDRSTPLTAARVAADGTYLLIVPKPGVYRLDARADGFRTLTIPRTPLVEPTLLPPLTPISALPLALQVLDSSGRPAAGATVRIAPVDAGGSADDPGGWRPTDEPAFADADGRAVVRRPAKVKVRVDAESADAVGSVEVEPDAGWSVLTMAARPGLILSVRDAAGRAAAGALVYSAGRAVAVVGDDGRAEIAAPALDRGPLLLLAENGEWAEVKAPPRGGKSPLSIRLAPPKKARVRVLTSDSGQPLPGAVAWTSGNPGPGRDATPDARGSFEILVAAARPAVFGAAAKGYLPREAPAPASGAPVDLRLERAAVFPGAAAVSGVVVDIRGIPIAGAELYAVRTAQTRVQGHRPQERFAESLGATSQTGGFLGEGLVPGRFDLLARAKGFVPGRVGDLNLRPGQRLFGVRIVLIDGVRVEGKVTDPDGHPIEGAAIEAGKILPPGIPVAEVERPGNSAVTDRDGRFTLLGLETGTYRVWAESPQGDASGTFEATKEGGRIDLQIAPPAKR